MRKDPMGSDEDTHRLMNVSAVRVTGCRTGSRDR
jgi:hypothetical protein